MNSIDVPVVKKNDQNTGLLQLEPGQEGMKTVTESTQIFQLMESRDEQQMLEEVMGVFSKEYVYDIAFKGGNTSKCSTPDCYMANKKNHTHVRGLSWSGVKEARRIFKAIDTREVSKPIIIEHDGKQFYECKVTAVDLRTGNVTTTYKRHPLKKQRKDGSFMEDPYAFEVVQSKAKRNAISELLPQPLVRGWIGDWVNGKKNFDPARVTDLKEGVSYEVKKDAKASTSSTSKPKEEPRLPKAVLDKLNSVLRDFEEKGGLKTGESIKQYCSHFKVKNLAYISVDQANKIIKAVNARIAQIAAQVPGTQDVESPDSNTKAENIQLIKDKLIDLGWDLKDPKMVSSLLKQHGLDSLDDLEKADEILVKEILDKVAGTK